MSLGSRDGANSLQLYCMTEQYPGSSTSESTYPTSNLGTQGPAGYILLPGMRTGYASNATSDSSYGNPDHSASGSNSSVVCLMSPNSQSNSQVVARYPYTTSGYSQSSVPQTYPNRLPVTNPSSNGSSYNISIPQSFQGFVPPASVSNSGNVICPGPTDPPRRVMAESNTGGVARWNGQSYNKTTVTTGSSYTKVETYSKWTASVEPSFVQYPGGSGTLQPNSMVYTGHSGSNENGTVAYYSTN